MFPWLPVNTRCTFDWCWIRTAHLRGHRLALQNVRLVVERCLSDTRVQQVPLKRCETTSLTTANEFARVSVLGVPVVQDYPIQQDHGAYGRPLQGCHLFGFSVSMNILGHHSLCSSNVLYTPV